MSRRSMTRNGLVAGFAVTLAVATPAVAQSSPDLVLQFSQCRPQLYAPELLGPDVPYETVYEYVGLTLQAQIANALRALDMNGDDFHCSVTATQVCARDSDCEPPACPSCVADERCLPVPEVRRACVDGTGGRCVWSPSQPCDNFKLTFGVWFTEVGGYGTGDTTASRNRALRRVNVLAPGENFAFRVGALGVHRLVDARWRDQPKVVTTEGVADPNGAVHLESFGLEFYDAGDRSVVELGIQGWYEGWFSETDFALNVWDYLRLSSGGAPQCETQSYAYPTETTTDTVIINSGLGDFLEMFVPLPDAEGDASGLAPTGPGCQLAPLFPTGQLLPGVPASGKPEKLVYTYTRISAAPWGSANAGLTFAGTWVRRARTPFVAIEGPVHVIAGAGDPFIATYRAHAEDLRPPLRIVWDSSGAAPVPPFLDVTMVWDLPWVDVDEWTFRDIGVTVIDDDGLDGVAHRRVTLERVLDPDWNPLCEAKPWHPDCQ